jgi:tRNA(fMet)-specific endonuclease VapC
VRYLLDTNVISDLVRNPHGPAAQRLTEVGDVAVCTSVIVAAELWDGADKRGSPRLTERLEAILAAIEIVALEPVVAGVYARLRTRLEQLRRPIGANDLLIAAHTVALGFTLVTDNSREFERIEELALENWVR